MDTELVLQPRRKWRWQIEQWSYLVEWNSNFARMPNFKMVPGVKFGWRNLVRSQYKTKLSSGDCEVALAHKLTGLRASSNVQCLLSMKCFRIVVVKHNWTWPCKSLWTSKDSNFDAVLERCQDLMAVMFRGNMHRLVNNGLILTGTRAHGKCRSNGCLQMSANGEPFGHAPDPNAWNDRRTCSER